MVVLPSDHYIDNIELDVSIKKAIDRINNYNLILLGVKATTPETGYGYIKGDDNNEKVLYFKEKPNIQLAYKYVANNYLWNSGIFIFNNVK
jgi:mannose-1-phosphate guanylyltransferase